MYEQIIYWQDFTLDFREIRWTFGRAWDWAYFCESTLWNGNLRRP